MVDIYALSDTQIQSKIGARIKAVRLAQNITQRSLAESAATSLSSVKKIESGSIGTFDSLVRVMRTLGLLQEVQSLCEEPQLSPGEYYELQQSARKRTRKHASGHLNDNESVSEW